LHNPKIPQLLHLIRPKVAKQKLDYIHNNPVVSGFVTEATEWEYSSARNFAEDHTILEIDDIGFMG
jgi:putative transposase